MNTEVVVRLLNKLDHLCVWETKKAIFQDGRITFLTLEELRLASIPKAGEKIIEVECNGKKAETGILILGTSFWPNILDSIKQKASEAAVILFQ